MAISASRGDFLAVGMGPEEENVICWACRSARMPEHSRAAHQAKCDTFRGIFEVYPLPLMSGSPGGPLHCEPPAVLPLVVRAALRLMEYHRPTRQPPPTRPDPPRARPAQTYAPTQPHPPRFMHTTREEWRDLLFLSYEYHAKRERWRSC